MPLPFLSAYPPRLARLPWVRAPGLWIYMGFSVIAPADNKTGTRCHFAMACMPVVQSPQLFKRKGSRVRFAYGQNFAARLALCRAGGVCWLDHTPSCRPPLLGILHPRLIHRCICKRSNVTPHASKNIRPSFCNHCRAPWSPACASFDACTITAAASGLISKSV